MVDVAEIDGEKGEIIALVIYNDGKGSQARHARLIATAPELLEAAKAMFDWAIEGDWRDRFVGTRHCTAISHLKKAIAHAEGKEQP